MSVYKAQQELTALRQEIERLETRLNEARLRATKLAYYVEMAAEFGSDLPRSNEAPAARFDATPRFNASADVNGSRPRIPQGGMSGRAVRESIALLRERNHPLHTREIYEILEKRGITLGGTNPINALSGYLSRSPGLIADRSTGWSLEEWGQPQNSSQSNVDDGESILPETKQLLS